MRISVFIPTYNYAAFLPRAIDSVLAQTLKPVEVIIADDGSTDGTADVVAGYGDAVTYLRFDHQGVYAVRGAVLDMLKGEWFLNLDADNWIEPDFLEKAAGLASADHDDMLAFVYPDVVTFGDYERFQPVAEFDVEGFKTGNFVDMNSLIKTEVARCFGFDPAFNDGWGDYDFFLMMAKHGYHGIPLRSSPLHYRVHAGSITATTKHFDKKQRLMKRMVEKHADFFSSDEANRAVRRFAPEAVMRHRLSEFWWAHRYADAMAFAVKTLLTHPSAFFSPTMVRKIFR